MAKCKTTKPVSKTYLFWLRSSRGTNIKQIVDVCSTQKGLHDVKMAVQCWAERKTAGTACQEYSYGYKLIKVPNRRITLKKFKAVAKRKQKICEEYDILREMLLYLDRKNTKRPVR